SCIIENTTILDSTISKSSLSNSNLINVTVIRSEGLELDGRYILAISSDLMFKKTKPSEIDQVLPMMFNMILMIFIIVPATLPTIIATYSIVGEKNNRSLEPLLATPTTDGELLAGKIFSAFIPSMGATYLAFSLGVVLLDIVLIPKVGYPLLPNLTWILSMALLAPTACLMSVLACVLVSSKVNDVRAAQQLGGFVVMPVVVLMLGVLAGFIFLSPVMIFIFAGLYGLLDLGLFFFARAIFNREAILTKWS
ncbi:MAG TPA: ABC transporter permease subunit, partial [Thermoplasmata archaeon]|nr:ABC transporter permease subunit [Thermoplasmata archaeon]